MKYIFLFCVCVVLVSCFNDGDCLVTATNYMHIQFKKRSNTKTDTLIQFAYKSVEIEGKNIEILRQPTATEILLPLDIDGTTSSTTFIFHRVSSKDTTITATDTIQFSYTKQSKVIGKNCGAFTYYQNLKLLSHSHNLDSTQFKVFNNFLLKDPSSTAYSAYAINYQIFY